MGDALSAGQLKRLTEHKYSAEGTSFCEPTMQKFWRWLVEQIPLWWAPNAITLVGLAVNVLTTVILFIYSPDAKQEPPALPFLLCAVGLLFYQTLDAIDGKQARRTSSATPLGELFDHGCDSVSTVVVILGVCLALQMGMYPGWLFMECFMTMVTFYGAHWQTYCTGTLKFGTLDVTEAQFLVMTIYFASALFGSRLWEYNIPIIGLELRFIPVLLSMMGSFISCQSNFSIIFIQGGVGKSGSTVAGTSVLSPLLPMGTMVALAVMIWQKSPSQVYENHPVLYIMMFGLAAAKITNKLVFYCSVDLLRYSVKVCQQICDYLDIYCFKITPPSKAKSTDTLQSSGKSKHTVLHNNGTSSQSHSRPATRQQSAKGLRK